MPAKKPKSLHTSHHTKEELAIMDLEQEAAKTSRKCFEGDAPSELINEVAVKEWERIKEALEEMDIIGDLDLYALIGYCNAFAFYIEVTKELSSAGLLVGDEKSKMPNPLIRIQDLYAKQMRDYAIKAGLAVDTRLKHASLKVKKDNNELTDIFGDF